MAKKKTGLSEEEILVKVNGKVAECVGWYDSRLSKERERVIKHYNSQLPLRQSLGHSSYISSDVYDSVEAMKAQLTETFSGNGDEIVAFPPQGPDDVETARIATEYCSYVVFRENDGYALMRDVIHDGLTARAGIAKVFWETIYEYEEHEFEGAAHADVIGVASQDDVADLDAEEQPDGTFAGTMRKRIDRSKVTIIAVPPEEFLISPRAISIPAADATAHRTLKTKAELTEMYPDFAKEIAEMGMDDSKSLDTTAEVLARHYATEGGAAAMDNAIQPELDKVMFFEAFVRMDKKDGRGARLYKVCYANQVLFSCDEVDRTQFIAFVPLPVPHCFYGNNFAQRVVPTQNARTVLTRAVLDHAAITTNVRYTVLKGGLLNPKEMQDNRLGGLVNINRPDAVRPLEQQPLNPFVFQLNESLKANKEESTGISSLSQGMNKDAISTQNSEGLIDNLVSLSQQRQKIVARNFANGFLIPLYLEVYRLVLENEKKEKIIEIAGNYVPVTVQSWKARSSCKVALHLGYGDRDRQAAKHTQAYSQLAADPALAPLFSIKKRAELANDTMKLAGFTKSYLEDPDTVKPPEPDPFKVKELEIKEMTAKAALISAEATATLKQVQAQNEQITRSLEEMKTQFELVFKQRESDRLDLETANRIDVSQREIELAENAPPEQTNNIVSPNG
jgi:hypothetical protein